MHRSRTGRNRRRESSRYHALRIEPLESRQLLAGWQNPQVRFDVNHDGSVTPLDALVVINQIARGRHSQSGADLDPRPSDSTAPYYDVNGDGQFTPLDALQVINALARNPGQLTIAVSAASESDPNGNGFVQSPSVVFQGQTSPHARIEVSLLAIGLQQELVEQSVNVAVAQADTSGRFSFDLQLYPGRNRLSYQVRDELGRETISSRELVVGNSITDWNAAALNVVRDWTTTSDDPFAGRIVASTPPVVARNLAMIHAAMFDAINGVVSGYRAYQHQEPAPPGTSATAAAAMAAYEVARALYPKAREVAVWEATLYESLRRVADGPGKVQGIEYGQRVGASILQARLDDGAGAITAYVPGTAPGQWNRTAPNYFPPLVAHWGSVRPLAVNQIEDYRPGPPPPLTSVTYAADVDEVMRLGRIDSEERTAEQTEIALFWVDGPGTATPAGHWNRIAVEFLLTSGQSELEQARTLALLNLAMADAGIAAWDAKYAYELWRPIDAIRRADEDGNAGTVTDTSWLPLILTPNFPAYTSGHSSFSGAAAAVLTELFGDHVPFADRSDGHSGMTQKPLPETILRQFTSFKQAAEEAGMSRIYGGIHYKFDSTAGLESGWAIGQFVIDNALKQGAG